MECKFHIGQKVVCISAESSADYLVQNEIYTIQDIISAGDIYIALVEVGHPSQSYNSQPGWFYWRFRPLQDTKTDISVFNKLLSPSNVKKKKVLEDA